MRRDFQMTQEQMDFLLKVCELREGETPFTIHPRVNAAWEILGKQMGFDPLTADEIQGKDASWFSAEETVGDG